MTDRPSLDGERQTWLSPAFVPLALLTLLAAAYLWGFRFLPPRHEGEQHWGDAGANWFGHGQATSYGFAAAILAFLFTLRYGIVRRAGSPAAALAWYALLLASVLPVVWLLVVVDWDNEAASPAATWGGDPIALLAVPTAFLLYDVVAGVRLRPGRYVARCMLEVVLIPPWAVAWVYFEFYGLGWIGP